MRFSSDRPNRLRMVAAMLVALSVCAWARAAAAPKLLRQCPGGRLYQVGAQRVLLLHGTPYRMGLAHGTLLKAEAATLLKRVMTLCFAADAVQKKNPFADSLGKAYARLAPFIPARYQAEMCGLADGSGLPLRDVQRANIFPALFHCSGFALFGGVTRGGQLLHGRVLDYMTNAGLQDYAVTIVARPVGYNAFVSVGYAGFVGSVTGMNDKQIAVGEMGGRGEGKFDGMPMGFLFRKVLEEAGSLDKAVDIFRKAPRTCEYYYVVSDGKSPDARGLYCTPERVDVVKPGATHAGLPDAIDDAVVFSAGSRLKTLLARIRAQRGRIDARAARDLMTRPVAMASNLHNVLFAPQSLEFWVAHASGNMRGDKPQACYQPYQAYRMRELMKLMPPPATAPAPAPTTRPVRLTGRVPATVRRPIAPCNDADLTKMLKRFEVPGEGFDWSMTPIADASGGAVLAVEFPTPMPSPVKRNNTVHCEYFPAVGPPRRPAVIVLHILDGRFLLARAICRTLRLAGVSALLVKMPYYGPRHPKDRAVLDALARDPDQAVGVAVQAVADIRRAARWLSARPNVDPDRIGLCGVSLGGFAAALAGGVDGRFDRVAIVLAGGNIDAVVIGPAREVRAVREQILRRKWSPATLRSILAPIEPMTYASRLKASRVLMVASKRDTIVPPACAEALARACGARITWRPAGHYSMIVYLPQTLVQLVKHFGPDE